MKLNELKIGTKLYTFGLFRKYDHYVKITSHKTFYEFNFYGTIVPYLDNNDQIIIDKVVMEVISIGFDKITVKVIESKICNDEEFVLYYNKIKGDLNQSWCKIAFSAEENNINIINELKRLQTDMYNFVIKEQERIIKLNSCYNYVDNLINEYVTK